MLIRLKKKKQKTKTKQFGCAPGNSSEPSSTGRKTTTKNIPNPPFYCVSLYNIGLFFFNLKYSVMSFNSLLSERSKDASQEEDGATSSNAYISH